MIITLLPQATHKHYAALTPALPINHQRIKKRKTASRSGRACPWHPELFLISVFVSPFPLPLISRSPLPLRGGCRATTGNLQYRQRLIDGRRTSCKRALFSTLYHERSRCRLSTNQSPHSRQEVWSIAVRGNKRTGGGTKTFAPCRLFAKPLGTTCAT